MAKSIEQWIAEGQELYDSSLREYRELEVRLRELQSAMDAKQAEVDKIAVIIGKQPLGDDPEAIARPVRDQRATTEASANGRRVDAHLVNDNGPNAVPNNPASIARALTGRGLGR